ncbi:MAG TPA: FlgD immunoglobulin-like domain containing protein, partial [Paludibacteraceae bacterium]|nr:FlgD immunoglobulin-like domain containing protein [Paludibacteraceae bacterium]
RLHYDITTQDASNWHSASFTCGYGTPGYQNSQFTALIQPTASFQITPKSFSPNNDGNDDTATIYYSFDEAGYFVTIRIYNSNGNCVRNILQNNLSSTEEKTSWDGTDDNGKLLPIGIYIVTIEAFTPTGKRFKSKEVIVLAAKI